MKGHVRATFASLGIRNFRLFFIGQSISEIGSWMQKMAQAWLILELTDSGTWLGVTLAAQQIPTLLITTWAGLLADRQRKRTILIWTASAGAVPALALGLLVYTGHATMEVVLVLALVTGVIDAIERPARQAFPGELVDSAHLANAVTLSNVMQNSGKAVGPAVAGVLISVVGMPWTFVVNAASFAAVILGLALMDTRALYLSNRVVRTRGQVREGFRYVRRTPALFGPLALLFATGLLAYNFQVTLPLIARDTFDGDAALAGAFLAALGLGSVLGGVALAGLLHATLRRMLLASALLGAVFAAIAVAPTAGVALAMVFVLGAVSVLYRSQASTWLQLTAEPSMRGRVISILVLCIGGTTPFGAPLVGWSSNEFGTRATFAFTAVGTLVASVAVAAYLRRHAAELQPDPQVLDEATFSSTTARP
jgi:MFS family permease